MPSQLAILCNPGHTRAVQPGPAARPPSAYLHDSRWVRAFPALGLLYVVTSSFTLAKRIRDRQEEAAIVSRVDQVRLDKLLTGQDLLRVENN